MVPKSFNRFNCCRIVCFNNKMLKLKTSFMLHYVHAAAHLLDRIENYCWQNHRKQSQDISDTISEGAGFQFHSAAIS